MTRNWADTDEGYDPRLTPLQLAQSPAEALLEVAFTPAARRASARAIWDRIAATC